MNIALFLGLASVISLYPLVLPADDKGVEYALKRTDFIWLTMLTLGVASIGAASPDPLVGITIGWVAIHPWWVFLGILRGVLPDGPRCGETYRNLWPVGGWGEAYLLTSRFMDSHGLRLVAAIWVVWALLNVAATWYVELVTRTHPTTTTKLIPKWWNRTTEHPPGGICGGNFLCSWSLCLATLASVFLGGWWILAAIACVLTLPILRHYLAPISCAVGLVVFLPFPWNLTPLCMGAAIAVYKWRLGVGWIRIINNKLHPHGSISSRRLLWAYGGALLELSQCWGIGLGGVALFQSQQEKSSGPLTFNNLHSDWLQTAVELSPIPVLFAIAELGRRVIWPLPGQDHAFALALVLFTAVYAIAYFPMRHAPQALVLAIALGYR